MSGHRSWQEIRARGKRPIHVFLAERDGNAWFLKARDLERVFTQVRRLDQAVEAATEVTALMLDVPPDSFNVTIRIAGDLAPVVERVRSARDQLDRAKVYLAATTEEAVEELTAAGLSLRDAGAMLGISHQRVAQLIDAAMPLAGPTSVEALMAALEASVRAARNARAHPEREVALERRTEDLEAVV